MLVTAYLPLSSNNLKKEKNYHRINELVFRCTLLHNAPVAHLYLYCKISLKKKEEKTVIISSCQNQHSELSFNTFIKFFQKKKKIHFIKCIFFILL